MNIGFIDTSFSYEEAIAESEEAKKHGVILIPSHYKDSFTDFESPYTIWYGSRVSAKTVVKALQYLYKAASQKYFRGLYSRQTQKDARDTQFQLFDDLIRKWYPFLQDEFVLEKTSMVVRHKPTDHFMKGASFEEMPRSLTEYTDFWVDEPITRKSSITMSDLLDISGTLRNSYGVPTQKHLTFNPISLKTEIYKEFFSEEKTIDAAILKANYTHNVFAPPEKIKEFESYKHFDYPRYLVDALGEWGVVVPKSPAFQNFDVNKHVGSVPINPNYPLIFGVDFNGDPLACTVWQIYWENGKHYIHCVKEIKLENKAKTTQLIDYVKRMYPNQIHSFRFRGDATGRAETTANLANWTQIDQAFRLNQRLELPSINPHVKTSVELCDYIFYWHSNLMIDKSCETLIFELQYTEKDESGALIKKDRNKAEQRADFVDTMRYVFNWDFAIIADLMANPSKFGIKI